VTVDSTTVKDLRRPEVIPALIDPYTFVNNDNETIEALLNQLGKS
jgi:hypothetical protein